MSPLWRRPGSAEERPPWGAPTTFYVALLRENETIFGPRMSEPDGGGYARVKTIWHGGDMKVVFLEPTGPYFADGPDMVTHFAYFTDATSRDEMDTLFYSRLVRPRPVVVSAAFSLDITIKED